MRVFDRCTNEDLTMSTFGAYGLMRKTTRALVVLFACLALLACSKSSYSPSMLGSDIDSSTLAGNRDALKLINEYNDAHRAATIRALEKKLARFDVKILSVGQDYMMTIPSAQLFYANSPRITWPSYAVLDIAADYLKQYTKISVRVACFTDNLGSSKRNRALSEARARKVSDYLWSQHVGARMLYTKGYGAAKPLYPNRSKASVASNNRVEITFRNIVA